MSQKTDVEAFWEAEACGERYAEGDTLQERLESQRLRRYELEPFIAGFARFEQAPGNDVLEVGVGMGADHLEWARHAPRSLAGVDLTARAVDLTQRRLATHGFSSELRRADAESLPFPSSSYDIVYSWGVLHHSPDTPAAIAEVHRVLRDGGTARVMIYNRWSITGMLLWLRYGLFALRPFTGLTQIYATHLESPGTKAYSRRQARRLFAAFSRVRMTTELSPGDLLAGGAGARHAGVMLRVARRVWPRALVRMLFRRFGLYLLISAVKKTRSESTPHA